MSSKVHWKELKGKPSLGSVAHAILILLFIRSFQDFDRFLKGQAALSFLTRYLKKDDILREIQDHDQAIHDCMYLFHVSYFALQGSK